MKRIFTTIIFAFFIAYTFASVNVYAPNLIAPADSAEKQHINVLLNWSPVAGAMNYKIWIDSDSLFSNPIELTSVYSAKETDQLMFDTQYFWKVQAIGSNSNDTSDWSIVRTFFTIDLVELVTPLDSAIAQTPKNLLKWKALFGVKYYDIICDTTPSFDSPLLIINEVDLSLNPHMAQMQGTTVLYYYSQTEVNNLLFNTEYFWSVRARHDNDTTDYCAPRLFTTLDTLILSSPADSAINTMPDVELRWEVLEGATKYQIDVDTVGTFDSPVAYTVYTTNNIVKADTLNFNQAYFWRVRAMHLLDTTIYSDVNSFTIIEKPVLSSPNDNATLVSIHPLLKWQAMTGVTEFDIMVANNPSFNSPMLFTVTGAESEILVNNFTLVLNETYYWKVKAMHHKDTSDWSLTRSFTTGNTGTDNHAMNSNVSIYPNPAINKVNINLNSDKNSEIELNILDITGRLVYSEVISLMKGQNTKQVNLSSLCQGIYIVNLKNDSINFSKKLILNN